MEVPQLLLPLVLQGGRSYSWLTEENLFYANWQDGEPQQLAGCSYMDTDGSWRTAGCDTKLQGGICQLQAGAARGGHGGSGWGAPKGWRWHPTRDLLELCACPRGAGCPSVLWDPSTLCLPHLPTHHVLPRCPPHAQVELQRQLSQIAGGLVLDPLPGPLLHLPHGDHPGAEGCHEEVPERYGEAVVVEGGDPLLEMEEGGVSRMPMGAVEHP